MRFAELEQVITDPTLFDDAKKAREILREHSRVKELITTWDALERARKQLIENEEFARGNDAEMADVLRSSRKQMLAYEEAANHLGKIESNFEYIYGTNPNDLRAFALNNTASELEFARSQSRARTGSN